jgi:hypothetical protein
MEVNEFGDADEFRKWIDGRFRKWIDGKHAEFLLALTADAEPALQDHGIVMHMFDDDCDEIAYYILCMYLTERFKDIVEFAPEEDGREMKAALFKSLQNLIQQIGTYVPGAGLKRKRIA